MIFLQFQIFEHWTLFENTKFYDSQEKRELRNIPRM